MTVFAIVFNLSFTFSNDESVNRVAYLFTKFNFLILRPVGFNGIESHNIGFKVDMGFNEIVSHEVFAFKSEL